MNHNIFFTIISLVFMAGVWGYFMRVVVVFRYRSKVIDKIHDLNVKDIHSGHSENCDVRWKVYESISADKMMRQFWRKPRSFYPEALLRDGSYNRK